ncbi:transposase [uncultured Ruminococcus sp.]|jgi:transposase-like protein|nr:transposase [uncultured Ruminococcus sp.]
MSRRKLTDEERIAAVQDVLNGNGGCKQIAPKYGINHETLTLKNSIMRY